MVFITATPLLGASEVVRRFLHENNPDRGAGADGARGSEHIPAQERERIIAAYPAHEIEARVRGIPVLGSGRVYPVAEEVIAAKPSIPRRTGIVSWGWTSAGTIPRQRCGWPGIKTPIRFCDGLLPGERGNPADPCRRHQGTGPLSGRLAA